VGTKNVPTLLGWKLSRLRGQGVSEREAADWLKRGLDLLERLAREGRLTAKQQGWAQDFRDELAKLKR